MNDEDKKLLKDISQSIQAGFLETGQNISLVKDEVRNLGRRMGEVETRLNDVEVWRNSHSSDRVKGIATAVATEVAKKTVSSSDLSQSAALAEQIAAHEELVAEVKAINKKQNLQLTLLTDIRKFSKNPYVKQIVTILLLWLALKLGVQIPGIGK